MKVLFVLLSHFQVEEWIYGFEFIIFVVFKKAMTNDGAILFT